MGSSVSCNSQTAATRRSPPSEDKGEHETAEHPLRNVDVDVGNEPRQHRMQEESTTVEENHSSTQSNNFTHTTNTGELNSMHVYHGPPRHASSGMMLATPHQEQLRAPPAAIDVDGIDYMDSNSDTTASHETTPRHDDALLNAPLSAMGRKPSAESAFSTGFSDGDFSLNSQELQRRLEDSNSLSPQQQQLTSLGSGFGSLTAFIQDAGSSHDLGQARIGAPPNSAAARRPSSVSKRRDSDLRNSNSNSNLPVDSPATARVPSPTQPR